MNNHNIVANNRVFNPLNSICVVTGGSSGIGFSLIKKLKQDPSIFVLRMFYFHFLVNSNLSIYKYKIIFKT